MTRSIEANEVRIVRVRDHSDEVIVLRFNRHVSQDMVRRVTSALRGVLPEGIKLVVLDDDTEKET
jgi:hypothetical protein